MNKENKNKKLSLPDYTKGEEIFNMVTHIAGGGVGIVTTVLCVIFAALRGNAWGVVSTAIFGATMILLYTVSAVYHGLSRRLAAKKVFRVLDHCTIYLLIAGTYTPFSLVTLREDNPLWGWVVFGFVWSMAALGIIMNSLALEKFKILSMICYLLMGWCIIVTGPRLAELLGFGGMAFLLSGGIAYTLGAVLYGIGKRHRYIHSVFHIFVVFGSILHFFCILFYVA